MNATTNQLRLRWGLHSHLLLSVPFPNQAPRCSFCQWNFISCLYFHPKSKIIYYKDRQFFALQTGFSLGLHCGPALNKI